MVRTIRRYRSSQLGEPYTQTRLHLVTLQPVLTQSVFVCLFVCLVAVDTETSPSHLQTKAYVRQLQVIDNQNLLFDMSCKLEPRDT